MRTYVDSSIGDCDKTAIKLGRLSSIEVLLEGVQTSLERREIMHS